MAVGFEFLQALGIESILLWLLSFAIVFGLLSQANIPKDKPSRSIISIVIAFLVIFATPVSLMSTISSMSSSLLLIIMAIVVLIVFVEVAGMNAHHEHISEGKYKGLYKKTHESIFHKYEMAWIAAFLIIAFLIFMGAGGLKIIGLEAAFPDISMVGLAFFIVIVIAVLYMISNPD